MKRVRPTKLVHRQRLVFNLLEELKRGHDSATDLYAKLLIRQLFRTEPRLERQFKWFCEEWLNESHLQQ
jgi:hypothetical protein